MPNYEFDWKGCYVADPATKRRFGFLTSLSIGGQALAADQVFKDRTDPQAKPGSGVVAVLESFNWELGPTHAIAFSAFVSRANAQTISALVKKGTDPTVTLAFTASDFDDVEKKWYTCIRSLSAGVLTGSLARPSGQLALDVADDAVKASPAVDVYNIRFEIAPPINKRQDIAIASSSSRNVAYPWGG